MVGPAGPAERPLARSRVKAEASLTDLGAMGQPSNGGVGSVAPQPGVPLPEPAEVWDFKWIATPEPPDIEDIEVDVEVEQIEAPPDPIGFGPSKRRGVSLRRPWRGRAR
jgi:hypothetical protein